RAQALQIGEGDLGVVLLRRRLEAALRQPALQRHLAAFEADLVIAARARLLALVAAARGLAQARADAAADAATRLLGAFSRLDGVQFHVLVPTRALRAPSPGTRPSRSSRARRACPRASIRCWSCASRGRARSRGATRAC